MLEDGLRIGHILDPRSGRPVVRRASVTVWHPDALAADALSTADLRVKLKVLTAVLLGILALEQPGGRGPRRRSRNFDDLLDRPLVVPPRLSSGPVFLVSTDDSSAACWIFLR